MKFAVELRTESTSNLCIWASLNTNDPADFSNDGLQLFHEECKYLDMSR